MFIDPTASTSPDQISNLQDWHSQFCGDDIVENLFSSLWVCFLSQEYKIDLVPLGSFGKQNKSIEL